MRKFGKILLVVTMTALILLTGSCRYARPANDIFSAETETPVLHQAAVNAQLPNGLVGSDSTAFLVGEFTLENGTVARFNGLGDVTMIHSGNSSQGRYAMTEYATQEAVVSMTLNGESAEYRYALLGQDGRFSLTAKNGTVLTFTPVQY